MNGLQPISWIYIPKDDCLEFVPSVFGSMKTQSCASAPRLNLGP